jgi:hypothetical protein
MMNERSVEAGPSPVVEPEPKPAEPAHPSLRVLCESRRRDLTEVLRGLVDDGASQTRRDIEAALDALDGLLTGNLDQIPPVVAVQLSKWITSSKYLGAREMRDFVGPHQAGEVADGDVKGDRSWQSS